MDIYLYTVYVILISTGAAGYQWENFNLKGSILLGFMILAMPTHYKPTMVRASEHQMLLLTEICYSACGPYNAEVQFLCPLVLNRDCMD